MLKIEKNSNIQYYFAFSDLVVRAAREYFNASGSYEDQNMRLAEICLKLFPKSVERIKEELDLISALPMLQDFKIFMLPLRGVCNSSSNLSR